MYKIIKESLNLGTCPAIPQFLWYNVCPIDYDMSLEFAAKIENLE